jgi:GNAT superfamily N-acetyltransferase
MRLDVELSQPEVERDLVHLHERLKARAVVLQPILALPMAPSGIHFRYRKEDGELFVYAHDDSEDRLAGYTVFNRLVEVDRRADRLVRSPHSRYAKAYQRLGIATAVYQWALNAGMCLVSGARQSDGAHALWRSLSARYECGFVQVRQKSVCYLGNKVEPAVFADLHTRMLLLGVGWRPDTFIRTAACEVAPGTFAQDAGSPREGFRRELALASFAPAVAQAGRHHQHVRSRRGEHALGNAARGEGREQASLTFADHHEFSRR